MKLTDEHRAKAIQIRNLLKEQPAEVLYILSDFMDFDDYEAMSSQSVYDAAEKADIYSTDGEDITLILGMGMCLPRLKVTLHFEKDEYGDWELSDQWEAAAL